MREKDYKMFDGVVDKYYDRVDELVRIMSGEKFKWKFYKWNDFDSELEYVGWSASEELGEIIIGRLIADCLSVDSIHSELVAKIATIAKTHYYLDDLPTSKLNDFGIQEIETVSEYEHRRGDVDVKGHKLWSITRTAQSYYEDMLHKEMADYARGIVFNIPAFEDFDLDARWYGYVNSEYTYNALKDVVDFRPKWKKNLDETGCTADPVPEEEQTKLEDFITIDNVEKVSDTEYKVVSTMNPGFVYDSYKDVGLVTFTETVKHIKTTKKVGTGVWDEEINDWGYEVENLEYADTYGTTFIESGTGRTGTNFKGILSLNRLYFVRDYINKNYFKIKN